MLDIIVAALLVTTIGYAVVLNKRLAALRSDRSELDTIAKEFGVATLRAEESVLMLKAASEEAVRALQDGLKKADGIKEDLAYLITRGESAADSLEESVRAAGKPPKVSSGSKKAVETELSIETGAGEESSRSDAERELLKALHAIR